MALANKGTNVTKYAAGGSGDNIIPDGFIKTVEKVWLDNIAVTSSNTIGAGSSWDIAVIPAGKKLTGIQVYSSNGFGVTAFGTTSTISIGARYGTGAVTNATQFLAATTVGVATLGVNFPLTANTGLFTELTSSTHTIFLQFATLTPSVTGGTLFTKVSYT